MKHLHWMLLFAINLVLAGPAEAQDCGEIRGMGMGNMGMEHGNGMLGIGSGMCSMCGSMMGMGECTLMQGCPMTVLPYLEDLDLTDAQWGEINLIMDDLEAQVESLREDAGLANPAAAFIQLFASPTLTVSAIEDFAERATALSEEVRSIHDESLVRIHDVLSSDQLAELESLHTGDARAEDTARGGCGMRGMRGISGAERIGSGCGRGNR
jgi:hypothetical protein